MCRTTAWIALLFVSSLLFLSFPGLPSFVSHPGVQLFCAEPPKPSKPFSPESVKFVAHRIGMVRSEASCVADFNNDGKLDIMAGPFLYLAPAWSARMVRTVKGEVDQKGDGYYYDFMNLPLDVDGDGLLDVVTCSWHETKIEWYRNPGAAYGEWPVELVEKNGNFEAGELYDIDGDGKALEILPIAQQTEWFEVAKGADGKRGLLRHLVSEQPSNFGGGVGDVNGDGRPDILRPDAWFEGPPDPRKGEWKRHPLAVGHKEEGKSDHTPQILVHDVNSDGLNDIVTSSAHGYGIFWYEQVKTGGEPKWKQHLIDDTWTQAHSLALADIDNDGTPELIAGKRFRAHNGGDPEEDRPPVIYWYDLQGGSPPVWKRHDLCVGEGIGSGMSLSVEDLDGDGDLDVVVTGKYGGPVWLENKAK